MFALSSRGSSSGKPMKPLAIVLTALAVIFTVGIIFELNTIIRLAQHGAIGFSGPNSYVLVLSTIPIWLPSLALDVACFAIWRLISGSESPPDGGAAPMKVQGLS
jgi:hypothetical protein